MGRMFKDMKKRGNCQKQFAFVLRSCVHFRSFGVHSSMSAQNAIEKLQQIAKEAQKSEHRRRHEEEEELLIKIKVEEELRRAKKERMLNI